MALCHDNDCTHVKEDGECCVHGWSRCTVCDVINNSTPMSVTDMRAEIRNLRHMREQQGIKIAEMHTELGELRTALDKHQHADKEANPTITALNEHISKLEHELRVVKQRAQMWRDQVADLIENRRTRVEGGSNFVTRDMYQSALNDVDRLTRKVNALQDRAERLSFARREMFDRLLKKNRELRELEKQVYGHARIIPHSPVCDSNVDEKIAEINERLAKLEGLR